MFRVGVEKSLNGEPFVLAMKRRIKFATNGMVPDNRISMQPVPTDPGKWWVTILMSPSLSQHTARLVTMLREQGEFKQAQYDEALNKLIICTIVKQGK